MDDNKPNRVTVFNQKQSAEIVDRLQGMSPAKRALLELRLRKKSTQNAASQGIPRREDRTRAPLSFGQQRIWFLDQLEPQSNAYIVSVGYRFRGQLDISILEKSLKTVIRRHEILRTRFVFSDLEPEAVIDPELMIALNPIDLEHIPHSDREKKIRRHISDETQRSFDLKQGPLLRVKLFRIAEEDHILVLIMHHIITDAWSREVLYRELSMLYAAFQDKKPSPLSKLPIQYGDYALWQREWLQGDVLEDHLRYWKKKLGGVPDVLNLPSDHPRPAVQTYNGKRKSFTFSRELSDDMKGLGRREGVTLFMLQLAAFKTLLYRYSGQEDILVGSPIANRSMVEAEQLLGFFVNTLVFRSDLSGSPTFRELLSRVRQTAIEAFTHQDMPFERLVEELHTDRDLSRNPIFQVMFIFQNAPRHSLKLPELSIDVFELEGETSKFDLTLELTEHSAGFAGTVEYNTDLFEAATIDRMVGHLHTLLEGIVANPQESIDNLPLLTDAEKQQLLVDWNDTETEYAADECIHQLFESQVKRTPHAIAGIFGEEVITYDVLNRRANQLAHFLRRQGAGPETPVGISMQRSFDMLVGLLAILKTGAAYVPMDPAYPEERLSFLLQDSGVRLLLTHSYTLERLPDSHARVICIDGEKRSFLNEKSENPMYATKGDSPAYMVYTSGSTGNPKGVIGHHRGSVNRFIWMWKTFPFEKDDVCCQKTALSFVDSVWEIFGPLLQGVPLVLIPDEILKDPLLLIQSLAERAVTRIVVVPSFLKVLLDSFPDLNRRLPKLRFWITSGEEISAELVKQFYKSTPASILLNLYGSSEVSADCTWYDTRDKKLLPRVPIGRPISNTRIYVFDSNLQPVPVGVPGEIHVGGEGLADGYLNQTDLTESRFIPDPYVPGGTLYKTGDLARYRTDGNLEFLGRLDNQVKIRGYRIEVGEIEAALNRHPAVRENVVVVCEDVPDDKRLVAYLIAHTGELPSDGDLRRFLKERLPEYMVPAGFVKLDRLPLLPNGKTDRKALAMSSSAVFGQEGNHPEPKDTLELQLIGIWEKVLNRRPVGIHDNFFESGGHSLLAVRLVAEIESKIGHRLPLSALFEAPSIKKLSGVLRDSGRLASRSSLVLIKSTGSRRPFFCVHGAGGAVLELYPLARRLSPDQPFVGLQDPRIEEDAFKKLTIEEMASHYIREIRSVQPEGPYIIGGYCFGAIVAYEMAQQLQAHGGDVAALIIIEGRYRGLNKPGSEPEPSRLRRAMEFLINRVYLEKRNLGVRDNREKLAYLRARAERALHKSWINIQIAGDPFLRAFNIKAKHGLPYNIEVLYKLHIEARKTYAAASYDGHVIVFKANEKSFGIFSDSYLGWESLVNGELEVCEVPGLHENIIFEPWVNALAEKVNVFLDRIHHRL